jgi:hypothetical protein
MTECDGTLGLWKVAGEDMEEETKTLLKGVVGNPAGNQ